MKHQIIRLGLTAAIALAIPTVAVLAAGPSENAKAHANEHATLPTNEELGQPEDAGPPENAGQPENAGERPENHGFFVSQAARDHSTTGKAHGEAVSAVARGDDGKPDSAQGKPDAAE